MKTVFSMLLAIVATSLVVSGSEVDSLYAAMKSKNIKFDFKNSKSDDFWNYIDSNISDIVRDQASWDARKAGETINLMVIRGIKNEFSISGEMSMVQALGKAMEYFSCIAILGEKSLVVIPDSIKIDKTKYLLLDKRIYKLVPNADK